MAVIVGSARIDENGSARGGKPGDQNGKEVSRQSWYRHSKGWRVLRCNDSGKALKIAKAMNAACDNPHVGYDQSQRLTLYNAAKSVGFDIAKVSADCETDCSALVRVCLAYAGIVCPDFRTSTQAKDMLATGMFSEMCGPKYTDSADCLRRGDVLVTRTQGHTVVVLSDGSKAHDGNISILLRKGSCGEDVRTMQENLILLGYSCGKWGADGEFGPATEQALRAFQRDHVCEVDGIYGNESMTAIRNALEGR